MLDGNHNQRSGIERLQREAEDLEGIMRSNVDDIREGHERRLQDSLERAEDLEMNARTFQQNCRRIRIRQWWENNKVIKI